MTILELSGFFVVIKRVCSRLFTAYRGNIVGRHRLFDSWGVLLRHQVRLGARRKGRCCHGDLPANQPRRLAPRYL
jgi:hypothetical protein